jgi:hypothetical protein
MSTQLEVLNEYYERHPEQDIRANDDLLLNESARPVSIQNLESAAQRLGSRLAFLDSYVQAFRQFFAKHTELKLKANEKILADLHHGEEISSSTLEELLENPNIQAQLSVNAEYIAEQNRQQERDRLIKEILNGRDFFVSRRISDGRPIRHAAEELNRVTSLDELRSIYTQVSEERRLEALTPQEFRKERQAEKVQARVGAAVRTELPTHYTPSHDGDSRYGVVAIKAGQEVELSPANLVRLDKRDLRFLINKFSSAALDERLKRKPVGAN